MGTVKVSRQNNELGYTFLEKWDIIDNEGTSWGFHVFSYFIGCFLV